MFPLSVKSPVSLRSALADFFPQGRGCKTVSVAKGERKHKREHRISLFLIEYIHGLAFFRTPRVLFLKCSIILQKTKVLPSSSSSFRLIRGRWKNFLRSFSSR